MLVFHVFLEIIEPFSTTIIAVRFMAAEFFVSVDSRFMTAGSSATRKGLVATKVPAMKWATKMVVREILDHGLLLGSRGSGLKKYGSVPGHMYITTGRSCSE